MVKAQHSEQRVGVFIDVQNLYYSGKNLYNAKVNFNAILKKAVLGRKLIRAFAYVIKADSNDENYFFEALEGMGIEIRAKELQIFYGGHKKGDWDVGLAMDVVRMAPKLDTVIVVSGDGDFKDLLEYVRAAGCRTEAISFGRSSSIHLKQTADLFLDLDKDHRKYLLGSYHKTSPRSYTKPVSKGSKSPVKVQSTPPVKAVTKSPKFVAKK